MIGSLAPWFGAKRTMAPEIVRELGDHSVYWELFCGSMAVLMAKPPCRTEIVSDLHGDLVNLAWVIQDPHDGPKLYRMLRRVLSCETIFRDCLEVIRSTPPSPLPAWGVDLDRARDYFIASWQGMNGTGGTTVQNGNFAKRFTSSGGDSAVRWTGAVRSIPQFRKRLERVQVLRSDGIALAEKIEDREGTVIYADPPYLTKGSKYLHDFAEADHVRLAVALRRFVKTRVVVSYYADPRLASLYPGWNVRPVRASKGMTNAGKRDGKGRTEGPEVLLCNRPFVGGPVETTTCNACGATWPASEGVGCPACFHEGGKNDG